MTSGSYPEKHAPQCLRHKGPAASKPGFAEATWSVPHGKLSCPHRMSHVALHSWKKAVLRISSHHMSQPENSAAFLTGLGQRSDHYICARKGGTCNFSPCPLFTRIDGTCYGGKAKCCMR
uniref:Beta-defensin 1 n=1 Tax=Felis catus TaxID=9685 RepID=A0ABI7VVP4_FELCA